MPPSSSDSTGVAIIGAGIVGIAVAYYLCTRHRTPDLVLIDAGEPMGLTSSRSGENYRNWWPHPVMTAFTDDSIDLMEAIARETGNRVRLTRRGYALATRHAAPDALIAELHAGYGAEGAAAARRIRVHDGGSAAASYRPPDPEGWENAPDGVDVLLDRALIRRTFPSFAPDVAAVLHIRRAGDLSGQQLGQFMLEQIRAAGGRLRRATRVVAIDGPPPFRLALEHADGDERQQTTLRAERIVNAAGPHLPEIAALLGETLPVPRVFQQKIAFEDRAGAIPRDMPFAIDLDGQRIAWTEEERALLAADPATVALTEPMPGGIHCRPEGGLHGRWIKLGWAYNRTPSAAPVDDAPEFDPHFPDIVLRAASRLHPSLAAYLGRLPRGVTHYGGYYTMTAENWPLIGPMPRTPGAFLAGALSGYGTMAACAAGALCASWITGGAAALPAYAARLSPMRWQDAALMAALAASPSKGAL